MSMYELDVTVADGKYRVVMDVDGLRALRYGEPWRDCVGDNLIYYLASTVQTLQDAIITHRAQKADDRCIEDDDRLYEALGDGIKCDRRVGCQLDMVNNCVRFIRNRTEGGGWPTYAELEAERDRLRERVAELESQLNNEQHAAQ